MKGFIEVTIYENGLRRLIPFLNYEFTEQEHGVITCISNDENNYFLVKESYEEIKQLIIEAQ